MRDPPEEPCGAPILRSQEQFFGGANITHGREWYQGQKKVFLIVPGHTTLVRKDGVPPISCWD